MQAKKKESLKTVSYKIPPIFRKFLHKQLSFRLADGDNLTSNQFNFQLIYAFYIKQIYNVAGVAANKISAL